MKTFELLLLFYCVFTYLYNFGALMFYGFNNLEIRTFLIWLFSPITVPIYLGYSREKFDH